MKKLYNQIFLLSLIGLLFSVTACKKEVDQIIPLTIPTIKSVAPAEGTIGTELTIKGSKFGREAQVLIGAVAAARVEVASDSIIYATVPAGIAVNTLLAVAVRNPDGGEATMPNAFKAVAPVLNFVNSATKPSGNIGSTVILEGTAFGDLQGDGQVLFSNGAGGTVPAVIASPEDWTNTFIITTVPQGAADGPVAVKTAVSTSNTLPFKVTASATFSPSAINWRHALALPVAVSGHSAITASIDDAANNTQQFVFVTGGRNSSVQSINQVLAGKIGADGNINAWNSTTALPEARSFHSMIAATPFNSKVEGAGFLYILGGTNPAGEAVSTVSVAQMNNNGTVGAWATGRPLPMPLHSLGAVIFRGSIYIAGGATTGNVPVPKVYKASIDTSGQLSEWQELASMPAARAYHGFVSFGGVLYAVGGERGTVMPDNGNYQSNDSKLSEVVSARINIRTGDLSSAGWVVNGATMQKSRSKHVAVVAGGNLFVSSGLYSAAGQGSSENTYAQLNADGTVGSFAGATGSNTLSTVGGSNLFNAAGLSYIDANGIAHVMIIGGDDVNNAGTKKANILYY